MARLHLRAIFGLREISKIKFLMHMKIFNEMTKKYSISTIEFRICNSSIHTKSLTE